MVKNAKIWANTNKPVDSSWFYGFISIKDSPILKDLEDIPFFESDNDFIKVNNYLVLVYIAHITKMEFRWQRCLIHIVPKYFLKNM